MGTRVACPQCGGRAYRVYSQVPKPREDGKGTLSTSVTIDAVFCGTPSLRDGAGALRIAKGQHGLIEVPHASMVRAKKTPTKPTKPKGGKKARRPHPAGKGRSGAADGPSANDSAGA